MNFCICTDSIYIFSTKDLKFSKCKKQVLNEVHVLHFDKY